MPIRPEEFESLQTLVQVQDPDHQKNLDEMLHNPNIDIGLKAIIAQARANSILQTRNPPSSIQSTHEIQIP